MAARGFPERAFYNIIYNNDDNNIIMICDKFPSFSGSFDWLYRVHYKFAAGTDSCRNTDYLIFQ